MSKCTIKYKGKSYTGTPEEMKTLKAQFDAEYQAEFKRYCNAVSADLQAIEDARIKAMAEINQSYGDKVYYDDVASWGHVAKYDGIIVRRNNIHYVKLDEKTNGRKYIKWHKGFKKVKP